MNRRVAEQLLGPAKPLLEALEARLGRDIEVRARVDLHQEQFEVTALGESTPISFQVPWLGGNGSKPRAGGAPRRQRQRAAHGAGAEAARSRPPDGPRRVADPTG